VNDARDVTERIDVAIARRGFEADDDVVSREHAVPRRHEHAALRKVEREIRDDAKVVLANHLTIETHVAAKRAAWSLHRVRLSRARPMAQFPDYSAAGPSTASMYDPMRVRRQ
jgi:hypothetical protein